MTAAAGMAVGVLVLAGLSAATGRAAASQAVAPAPAPIPNVHEHWGRERIEARAALGAESVPLLMQELTRVNLERFLMDSCGETYGEGLVSVIGVLAGRDVAARREISLNLQSPLTTPAQRAWLLLGLSNMRMIPPDLFDGLVASLACPLAMNRMRASELLGRMGDRRAVEPLREALRRETEGHTKIRIALHLAWLGEDEGIDTLARHARSDPRWDVRGVACGLLRHVRAPEHKLKALAVLRERIRHEDNQLAGAQVAGSLQVLEGKTWKEVMQTYMPWQVEETPPKAATVPAY